MVNKSVAIVFDDFDVDFDGDFDVDDFDVDVDVNNVFVFVLNDCSSKYSIEINVFFFVLLRYSLSTPPPDLQSIQKRLKTTLSWKESISSSISFDKRISKQNKSIFDDEYFPHSSFSINTSSILSIMSSFEHFHQLKNSFRIPKKTFNCLHLVRSNQRLTKMTTSISILFVIHFNSFYSPLILFLTNQNFWIRWLFQSLT